jgi:isocitrate lyase
MHRDGRIMPEKADEAERGAMRATTTLRQLLGKGEIVVAPGAYDGLSARLVVQAGFPAVYASGGAIARSTGVPDLDLLSMTAIADRFASMVDVRRRSDHRRCRHRLRQRAQCTGGGACVRARRGGGLSSRGPNVSETMRAL